MQSPINPMYERELLQTRGQASYSPPSFVAENFQMAIGQVGDEGLSISRYINEAPKREMQDSIYSLIADGSIPEDIVDSFKYDYLDGSDYDTDEIIHYLRNSKDHAVAQDVVDTLRTNPELDDQIRDHLRVNREAYQDVQDNATISGKIAGFAGGMNAATVDPLLLPTFFFGPGAVAKGAGYLKTFLSGAGRVAGAEMVAEAGVQTFVHRWKNDIGVEYNMSDALMAIGGVGLATGTIGGVTKALTKLSSELQIAKNLPKFMNAYDDTLDEVGRQIDNMKREADGTPNPNISAKDHFENIDAAVKNEELQGPLGDLDPDAHLAATQETVVAEADSIIKENPDTSIPMHEVDAAGNQSISIKKGSEVFDEIDHDVGVLTKVKDCLTGLIGGGK